MAPKHYNFHSDFNGRVVHIYSWGADNEQIKIEVKNKTSEAVRSVNVSRESFDLMIEVFLYARQFTHLIADGKLNPEHHHSTIYSSCDLMETDKEQCQVINDYIEPDGVYARFSYVTYFVGMSRNLYFHFKTFREENRRWTKQYVSLHFKEFASLILYHADLLRKRTHKIRAVASNAGEQEAGTSGTVDQHESDESRAAKTAKHSESDDDN